jgi:EamA domain-containing membrane protein RarD
MITLITIYFIGLLLTFGLGYYFTKSVQSLDFGSIILWPLLWVAILLLFISLLLDEISDFLEDWK